ncbi:hypothetical protein SAMN05216207_106814 [Pseudonocardia ammonioxydans]|uniref:Hemerythrin-like domain-containing protein n=1 Tax=Pseudonocardia ammonioxydans TaxID=260086 RepID=A0A1I5HL27_PSUAM|nr:hemerythrin domain-containing protein [Pseudonocardia ammonioxydans]SFO48977.1 hypothetical protein SAMN05216207_106814 [Pseudonocardia ammonioxydans]
MTETPIDVVDELTADHRAALELLDEVIFSSDPQHRRDTVNTAIAEVVRHTVAEKVYLHPSMQSHLPDGDEAVQHDIAEHALLEQVMKDLGQVEVRDPEFHRLVEAMRKALREHAEHQEHHRFPHLREHVPAEELARLHAQVTHAKQAAPTRPHRDAPHAEPLHKTVDPGAGMVDRLRERLTARAHDDIDPEAIDQP